MSRAPTLAVHEHTNNDNNGDNRNLTTHAQRHLLAASVGGLVTALVVCPFDVVKTRMQVGTPASKAVVQQRYNGTLDALGKIARTEGFLSLWRGLGPALMMAVPNAVIYFNSYEFFKKKITESEQMPSAVIPLLAGSTARVIAVATLSPLELLRTNMQALDFRRMKEKGMTTFGVFSRLLGKSGLKGLWTGLGPTLVRDVPFSAIYWTGYETIKAELHPFIPNNPNGQKNKGMQFLVHFVAGAMSGTVAALLTTPIDVIKTNAQVMNVNPKYRGPKKNAMDIFRTILKEEGWRGLTKGIVPRAVKVAPACAIMISSYELIKAINHE